MSRIFVRAKIHRATVTDANLNYKGSIAICPRLLEAAGILPYEFVHVNNLANGQHWETYAIKGNPGEITLHGPPARLFAPGDKVVVNCLAHLESADLPDFQHRVVYVNDANSLVRVEDHKIFED
jgi:aspartate 1-decarboxylase